MDPLVAVISFGIGIGVLQLSLALYLVSTKAGLLSNLLSKQKKSVALNREAVRKGELTAQQILSSKSFYKGKKPTLTKRLEQAGFLRPSARGDFIKVSVISILFFAGLGVLLSELNGITDLLLPLLLGLFVGYVVPSIWLEHKISARDIHITKSLPIVLDQLQIYLSSSLSLMPSIESYLQGLQQRESTNVVAICFEEVLKQIKTGSSPSEAFRYVGEKSGHPFLSHVFTFLSNSEDHGAGIISQIFSLNEQATSIYRIMIEEKIIRLPVMATFPLFLVFAGFFSVVCSGIVTKLMTSLPLDF